MTRVTDLPVAILGAGPVGLAAAAHLLRRDIEPLVLEASCDVAASMRDWGHVRLFSPWRYNIDSAASTLLRSHGWTAPPPEDLPTGEEIVRHYLRPLAAVPQIRARLRLGQRVVAVSRQATDKVKTRERITTPFVVRTEDASGIVTEHSCGTVRAHGQRELAHPDRDFYIVGSKSYGRAPTFLLATGDEQVRSVAAMLAGDTEAALRVELNLPQTGVYTSDLTHDNARSGSRSACC